MPIRHIIPILLFISSAAWAQEFKWSQQDTYPNFTAGTHLCTDNNHNVYVTGLYKIWEVNSTAGPKGSFLHKYDKTGKLLWKIDLPKVLNSRIALRKNDLLLSGTDSIGGFVARYSLTGFQYAIKYIFINDSFPYSFITGIGADSQLNYYIIGQFGRPLTINQVTLTPTHQNDFFILKFDPQDSCLWGKTGSGGFLSHPCLRVDPAGNSYVGGSTYTLDILGVNVTSQLPQAIVMKFNSSGNMLFLKEAVISYSTPWWKKWQLLSAIGFDTQGNVYYTGLHTGKIALGTDTFYSDNSNIYIGKINANGSHAWVRQIKDSIEQGIPGGLDVSTLGDCYVSGGFSHGCTFTPATKLTGFRDPFIAKYNSAGILQWAVKTGCINDQSNGVGLGLAVDADEHVFVTGHFSGGMYFGNWSQHTPYNSMFITMLDGIEGVAITENDPAAQWRIFPNPSSGNVFVQGKFEQVHVTLSDFTGKTILRSYFSGNSLELQTAHLPPGMYMLVITNNSLTRTTKLVLH